MIGNSMRLWGAALLVSLSVHLGLFIGFKPLTPGTPAQPAGVSVALSGTLAEILGSVPSLEAKMAKEVEPLEPLTSARVKTVAPAPTPHSKVAKPVTAALLQPVAPVAPAGALRAPSQAAIAPAESAKAPPIKHLRPAEKPRAEPIEAAVHEPVSDKAKPAEAKARVKPGPRRTKKIGKTKAAARQRAGGRHQGNAGTSRGGRRGTSRASAGAIASYGARVRARILANRQHASGLGRVSISFAISRSGSLRHASVSRSSGNGKLDRAALATVRRAAPFPSPPNGAGVRQLRFSIPITFR